MSVFAREFDETTLSSAEWPPFPFWEDAQDFAGFRSNAALTDTFHEQVLGDDGHCVRKGK